MSERDLLLRAVLDHPAEDTPRLLLADHLDELGGAANAARAEFVRLQCERARRPERRCDCECKNRSDYRCEWCLLGDRETALLRKWGAKWLPKVSRSDASAGRFDVSREAVASVGHALDDEVRSSYQFVRGFVERVWYEANASRGSHVTPKADRFGAFVIDKLAAHPVEAVTFEVILFDPIVHFRVNRCADGKWFATLDAGDRGAATEYCDTRPGLCAALSAFFAREVPQIHFTDSPIPF